MVIYKESMETSLPKLPIVVNLSVFSPLVVLFGSSFLFYQFEQQTHNCCLFLAGCYPQLTTFVCGLEHCGWGQIWFISDDLNWIAAAFLG